MFSRILAAALAAIYFGGLCLPVSADPPGNQIARWADISAAITAGELVQTGSCAGTLQVPSRADAVACFQNNGACNAGLSAMYYRLTWADVVSCRVVTSTVSATTDSWLVNGATSWPITTSSGTPQFVADASGLSGEPGGAQAFAGGATASAGSGSIQQQIMPSTINAGTKLVARAQLKETSQTTSAGDTINCGAGSPATATGSVTLEIVNASGVVQQSVTGSVGPFNLVGTRPFTVSSTGAYFVKLIAINTSAAGSYLFQNIHTMACESHSQTVFGVGYATDITIGNS